MSHHVKDIKTDLFTSTIFAYFLRIYASKYPLHIDLRKLCMFPKSIVRLFSFDFGPFGLYAPFRNFVIVSVMFTLNKQAD